MFLCICKNLPPDPYVLFLVMAAMFFHESLNKSKIKRVILCRILVETAIFSFIQIHSVIPEEKMFEEIVNDENDRRQVTAKAHMAYVPVS